MNRVCTVDLKVIEVRSKNFSKVPVKDVKMIYFVLMCLSRGQWNRRIFVGDVSRM